MAHGLLLCRWMIIEDFSSWKMKEIYIRKKLGYYKSSCLIAVRTSFHWAWFLVLMKLSNSKITQCTYVLVHVKKIKPVFVIAALFSGVSASERLINSLSVEFKWIAPISDSNHPRNADQYISGFYSVTRLSWFGIFHVSYWTRTQNLTAKKLNVASACSLLRSHGEL